ncbi:MAG: beta-ketoacyl synthase N-terminal-like domain-containing protein [Parabacteroides sp.]|nr:beta-ketoacyl synthase N-terminal-like domain-containing protein [Parabacteroides sp.]
MVGKGINIYVGASSIRTCLGQKTEALNAMRNGESGLRYAQNWMMHAGVAEVKIIPGYSKFESLLIEQVQNVIDESGADLSDKDTLFIVSTTKGNIESLAEDCEHLSDKVFIDVAVKRVADYFAYHSTPIIISNACISGVSAFVVANWLLSSGKCKKVIVAGCDVLCEFITSGFASFKSISAAPCRPYDAGRDGLTLGEGAGAILLTADHTMADKACIRLVGGAISNDANHISGPSRTGDGLFYAIRKAMDQAGVKSEDIGFINAHGTATRYNDEMESKAIAWAKLEDKPLNSLKGYIGHTLGASGVIETIVCIEQLKQGYIFGTKGFTSSDTPYPLNLSAGIKPFDKRCCVKTASGFGGCNAAIVLDMETSGNVIQPARRYSKVAATYQLPSSDLPFATFIRNEFKALGASNMKFYKMSDMCKALYVAVEHLLSVDGFGQEEPVRRAIVLANRSSSLDADIIHQQIINQHLPEGASPAAFVYTLANVAAGEMCIRHKIQGDNTFFIEKNDSGLAEEYAHGLIENNHADVVICGWCEYLKGEWNVIIKLLKNN